MDRSLRHWTIALYLCIGLTLLIVMGMAFWGINHDLNQVRQTFIGSEMERLRSHAERTVNRIQNEIRDKPGSLENRIPAIDFLRPHWEYTDQTDDSRLYAAVVDPAGRILLHWDRKREGQQLGAVWYDRVVPEAGDDVVDTHLPALTGGIRAYDVRVPIVEGDVTLGVYHSGLAYSWLESELAAQQVGVKRVWGWILACILVAELVATVSLFQISRRIAVLHETMKLARARRFAELGQLMAGIAHEIRNPLNAMRLNLHVLSRYQDRRPEAEAAELAALDQSQIIRETNQEIERVEGLMRILLGYARPDQPQTENLDVRRELESTLLFLKPVLERAEVAVSARFTEKPLLIHIDRDRLRQVLINLLNNAKEATGPGGQIQIAVREDRDDVEITVADDGPGVAPADRERIFDPFYSTKENGTGLGLALVRRYVEEVGGTVICEKNEPSGALFRLRFARVEASK